MKANKSQVFIGSSKEGLGIAQAIQLELEEYAICTIWYQGVFGLGEGTLESLENALSRFEFAIIVLTPDDLAIVRGDEVQLPRDNVLFELGLFMGHLGRNSVFAVYCDDGKIKLPSDLAGITVGRFEKPREQKELSRFSTTELLPHIGPVVSKIRSAIDKVQQSKIKDTNVFYITPTLSHSEYYAHLQNRIELELAKTKNHIWHYCVPQGDTAYDNYVELEAILKIASKNDVAVLVGKELDSARISKRFDEILQSNQNGRILLIDQTPPDNYLNNERVSFVGIDNRKVGILAAFALYSKMSKQPNRIYIAIKGPGGESRIDGFRQGVAFFDKEQDVETFGIGDVNRTESSPYLRQIINSCPPDTYLGIFAGNDETALAVIRALDNIEQKELFVVGCDATREMMSVIDSKNSSAIATIDTELYNQAKKIIQVIQSGGIELQEPKLYPISLSFRQLLKQSDFKAFWDGTK